MPESINLFQNQRTRESTELLDKVYLFAASDETVERMNRLESVGVLLIGIGGLGGSVATAQSVSVAVLPSVFIIAIGIAVTFIGRYR